MSGQNTFNQGEIVFMRIPYKHSGSHTIETKYRPVLIISNDEYNSKNNSVIVCSITKVIRQWQYSLQIDNNSMKSGNLPLKSELRVDMIHNIHKSEILKSMGSVKDEVLEHAIENSKKIISKN